MPCDLNDHLSIGKYEYVLSELSTMQNMFVLEEILILNFLDVNHGILRPFHCLLVKKMYMYH